MIVLLFDSRRNVSRMLKASSADGSEGVTMSSRSDLAREAYNLSQAATAVVASSIFVLILKIICCCQFTSSLFHLHSTFDYIRRRPPMAGLGSNIFDQKGHGAAQQVELGASVALSISLGK